MKKKPSATPAKTIVPPATDHAAQRPPARALRAVDRGTIAVAGAAILVVAVLAYPHRSSAPVTDEGDAAATPAVVAASAVAPRANASSKKMPAPRPERKRSAESTRSVAPLAAATPAADTTSAEIAAPKPSGSDVIARSDAAAVPTGTAGSSPITITGCLEVSVDHDEFRLTDTDGADAPKSRSWRSGFLKKRSEAVALLEPPSRLALETHVGRRVTATGLLSGHDMKVSALRAIGPPCN